MVTKNTLLAHWEKSIITNVSMHLDFGFSVYLSKIYKSIKVEHTIGLVKYLITAQILILWPHQSIILSRNLQFILIFSGKFNCVSPSLCSTFPQVNFGYELILSWYSSKFPGFIIITFSKNSLSPDSIERFDCVSQTVQI